MPGLEIAGSTSPENFNPRVQLKAHKVLPRKRDIIPSTNQHPATSAQPQNLSRSHISGGEQSRQVSTVTSARHAATRPSPRLPLTPPSNSNERFAEVGRTERPSARKDGRAEHDRKELGGASTPVNQHSPPTPDITPPNAQSEILLRPGPLQQNPSSRAESFQTARENQWSSDEEGQRSVSPSTRVTRQKWLDATRSTRLHHVGLGLGLELENEDQRTPTAEKSAERPGVGEFVTFDGSWGSDNDEVLYGPGQRRNENTNATKRLGNHNTEPSSRPLHDSKASAADHPEHGIPSLMRGLSLRDRIRTNRTSSITPSAERFAEEIGWPLTPGDVRIQDRSPDVDNRRFSAMSGTSTIVEAMVVDTPPQRKRTLRHTGKNVALRSSSSPIQQSTSTRSSLVSSERPHRLVHRNTRITERIDRNSFASEASTGTCSGISEARPYRNSFASEVSAGAASSMGRSQPDIIPVVVIPERQSSLPSSAASSRRESRSLSVSSAQKHLRSNYATQEAPGYFDIPRHRSRTRSDSLPSSGDSRSVSRKVRDFSPGIPPRSSSLSAPTSRNASRATSLTSASLKLRDAMLAPGPSSAQEPATRASRYSERVFSQNERLTGGEWSSLRPQSALVTPFSQHSIQSSTPGTLEVSEATAISIYPHDNRSILVVQQRARRDSRVTEMPRITQGPNTAVPGVMVSEPRTPPFAELPRSQVDSPLKNPREPPKPPEFKVIPPTPAVLTPASEDNHQLGVRPSTSDEAQATSRPMALVRRAFSTRRYSDTFVSPLTRNLSRRSTTDKERPKVVRADSKLHPFWRPRGFWDDISDSDSDFGNDGFLVSNSLGMTQKRAASGPVALARRLTGRSRSATRRAAEQGVRKKQSSGSLRSKQQASDGHRTHTAPGLGLNMQFRAWKGLQDRLERRRAQKEEERREKERARLRKSIGPMIVHPDVGLS